MTRKEQVSLISKLHLKKGCKYLIIFPESCGLTADDLSAIPKVPELIGISFLLKSTRGIKVVEIEQ